MSNNDTINVSINIKKVNGCISSYIESIKSQKNTYKERLYKIRLKNQLLNQRYTELKDYEAALDRKNIKIKNSFAKFKCEFQDKIKTLNSNTEKYISMYQQIQQIQKQYHDKEKLLNEQILFLQSNLQNTIKELKTTRNNTNRVKLPDQQEIDKTKNSLYTLSEQIKNLNEKNSDVEKYIKMTEINVQEIKDKISFIASFLKNEESKYESLRERKIQIIEAQKVMYKSSIQRFEKSSLLNDLNQSNTEITPEEHRKNISNLERKLSLLKQASVDTFEEISQKKRMVDNQVTTLQNIVLETSSINSANLNNKNNNEGKDDAKLEKALSLKYQILKLSSECKDINSSLGKEKDFLKNKKIELKEILENYQNYLDVLDRYYEEKYLETQILEKYAELKVSPSLEQKIKINDSIFEPDTSYKRFEREVKFEEKEIKKLKLELFENEKQNENLFKQIKLIDNGKLVIDMEEMKRRNSYELLKQIVQESGDNLYMIINKIRSKCRVYAAAQIDLFNILTSDENINVQKCEQYNREKYQNWIDIVCILEKTLR